MTPISADLRDLLRHGMHHPVTMTLRARQTTPGKLTFTGGYAPGETMIFLVDADGLEVRRGPAGLHVLRDGRDVLRRTSDHCWVFEHFAQRSDPPIRVGPAGITCPGALAWFLRRDATDRALPLTLWPTGQASAGTIAGRPTWILRSDSTATDMDPGQLLSLEIDREHGTILAVETGQERLEATDLVFPVTLPDPTWHGAAQALRPPEDTFHREPETAEIPGHVETLPPQSTDPRRLRVFVGETDLEGAFPDYRIGQSVRLTLGLSSLPAPAAGLATRRRGLVHNLGEHAHPDADGTPHWPITLTGDGWTATAHTPTPVNAETELEGWFHHSAYAMVDIPTDLRIERIFAGIDAGDPAHRHWQEVDDTTAAYRAGKWRIRDVILDATLNGAVPPPLRHDTFTPRNPVIADNHLWLCDVHLPVARCWDTATGHYRGQTLVPAPIHGTFPVLELRTDPAHGALALSGEHAWTLLPGRAVATPTLDWTPPTQTTDLPDLPTPWTATAHHGSGLYEAEALTDAGIRTALARITAHGNIDITELPPTGYTISSLVQINDEYIVRRWVEEHRLNDNLHILSTKHIDIDTPGWKTKGPIAYLTGKGHIRVLDRTTGTKLPGVDIPDGHQARALAATPTDITMLIHRRNPNHSMSILPVAVATYHEGTWITVELQDTPTEIL